MRQFHNAFSYGGKCYEPPSALQLMRARGRVPTDPKIGNKSTQKIHPKRNSRRLLDSIAVSAARFEKGSQQFVPAVPLREGLIPPASLRCVAPVPADTKTAVCRGASSPPPARCIGGSDSPRRRKTISSTTSWSFILYTMTSQSCSAAKYTRYGMTWSAGGCAVSPLCLAVHCARCSSSWASVCSPRFPAL